MTAADSIASTLRAAIDISKHRHEVLIGAHSKKRRRRTTIQSKPGARVCQGSAAHRQCTGDGGRGSEILPGGHGQHYPVLRQIR